MCEFKDAGAWIESARLSEYLQDSKVVDSWYAYNICVII